MSQEKDLGDLELFEGDVSVVIRSDGEIEVFIACDDRESLEYTQAVRLVEFIMFALKDERCRDLFEKSESFN